MKLFRSVGIFGSLVLAVLTGCSNAAREASKNDAPVAQQVMLVTANPARVGAVLQGSYQYSDPDGDGEKDTLKAWLRDGQPIDGANQNEYIASAQDSGKNLQFQVTPAAASGTSPGAAVASTGITIENSAPVVTLAPLVGAASIFTTGVGSELRVDFSYNDVDGDTAASAEIRWLRYLSPTSIVPIPDATTPRYKVTLDDLSYPLVAEVTPRALAGVLRGATVISTSILIVNSVPVAQNVELKASAMPVIVGTLLTASYSYFDADDDAVASGSAIQWLRNGVVLDGVTTPTYTLTSADAGASFQFTVTPKASLGLSPGVSVTSNTLTAVNSAPQASKVVVNGGATSTAVDMPLSASYTYGDLDLNSEGASVYRWYRGANIIPGATGLSYTVIAADSGANLSFEVTPVATLGTTPGMAMRSNVLHVNNSAPVAQNVTLSANTTIPAAGSVLTASYTYLDADLDPEITGGSSTRWLRSGQLITNSPRLSYTLVGTDAGTTITFEVTPKASTGTLSGVATLSNGIVIDNSAPTVTGVAIAPGTARVNTPLTATYTYSDANGDAEGTSLYEWRNGGTTVISTAKTYTVKAADAHQTLTVKVTPVATTGSSPGVAVTSPGIAIANSPPSITGLVIGGSVGGKAYTDLTLTASYSFQDADGDGEGGSTYQWFSGTTPIGGATLQTYVVKVADIDKALTVQVTPKDNFVPALSGTPVVSPAITPVNLAPEVSNVVVSGVQVLSVSYTYLDHEKDAESASGSQFRWLRDGATIPGAVTRTYTLTLADAGKTIAAEVTPLAQTGTSPGLPVVSNAVVPNSAPVAQNVTLNANAAIAVAGTLLTASYKYFDADGDLEGASAIRWLRNGTAITGASGRSYTASNNDIGQMLVFEVTPKAASGVLSGSATPSNGVAIVKTYSISGTVSNLIGNGLSLSLRYGATATSTETLAISASGPFTFATLVASGSTYALTITTNPTGQDCQFANSTNTTQGIVNNSAVSEALSCYTRKFNDTGITASQCYQAGGALAACNSAEAIALNPAQDGMVGRDANVATNDNTDGKLGFNFANVAGGCVQDNVTGLMWEVKTADGGLRDWSKTYTHYDNITAAQKSDGTAPTQAEVDAATNSIGFKAAVNGQALCGYNDWRLPTADELRSIVDYSVAIPPTVDSNWLPNTQGNTFWSASPYVGIATEAWNINFNVGYDNLSSRSVPSYVRLVRAGQSATLPRYTVSTDGQEVTDSRTNLIWRRCSEGMVFSGGTCTGTAGKLTHETALQLAATQATSTGIAWRLPNVKELASIADNSLSNPAIDATAFPATPNYYFWSASPFVGGSTYAWNVSFSYGNLYNLSRNNFHCVRLVRAGQ